jgi:hypothetical protein
LDARKSCLGEGILTGLWPTGFKTVRRTESSKKKILSMSTFLILAPEQRRITLFPVPILFPSGLFSLGLLPH